MNKIIWILFTLLPIFHTNSATPGVALNFYDNALLVYYKITNTAQTPIRVYKRGSPLEGFFYNLDMIRVTFEGEEVEPHPWYPQFDPRVFGPELPRVSERAFVLVNPGETITATLDLANIFDFSRVGTYHVEINPTKQFEIQELLENGELIIEECKDYQITKRKNLRKDLLYSICGIVEQEDDLNQEDFQKNFIGTPELRSGPPVELHSFLTLDPKEEKIKSEPITSNNEVPGFGILGSASLVINITPDNIPHEPGVEYNMSFSYCAEQYEPLNYGFSEEDFYFSSEEYRKKFEELECPEFSILKYRKVVSEAPENLYWKVRWDIHDVILKIEKILNPYIALFHEYIM